MLDKAKKYDELLGRIEKAKQFIYDCNDGKQGINYSGCCKILDILNGDDK